MPCHQNVLCVHQLPHEALAAGQVHVGFHPHATHRLPLAAGDALADALEQGRVLLLDPLVLRGLRADEAVLGVVVHHHRRRGEGAGTFTLCFPKRPQPRGVDVRVADGDHLVGARCSAVGEHGREQATGDGRGVGDVGVVERAEGPPAQHFVAAAVAELNKLCTLAAAGLPGQRHHQPEQHLRVEQEVEHLVVAPCQGCFSK